MNRPFKTEITALSRPPAINQDRLFGTFRAFNTASTCLGIIHVPDAPALTHHFQGVLQAKGKDRSTAWQRIASMEQPPADHRSRRHHVLHIVGVRSIACRPGDRFPRAVPHRRHDQIAVQHRGPRLETVAPLRLKPRTAAFVFPRSCSDCVSSRLVGIVTGPFDS